MPPVGLSKDGLTTSDRRRPPTPLSSEAQEQYAPYGWERTEEVTVVILKRKPEGYPIQEVVEFDERHLLITKVIHPGTDHASTITTRYKSYDRPDIFSRRGTDVAGAGMFFLEDSAPQHIHYRDKTENDPYRDVWGMPLEIRLPTFHGMLQTPNPLFSWNNEYRGHFELEHNDPLYQEKGTPELIL